MCVQNNTEYCVDLHNIYCEKYLGIFGALIDSAMSFISCPIGISLVIALKCLYLYRVVSF